MRHNENHSRARRAGVLAVTAGLALLSACVGGGSSTGSRGAPDPGGSQQLAFARCMRAHGVTDFPDSGGPLQPSPGSDLYPGNPTYRAARQACQKLLPTTRLSPAQAARNDADALKFSQCMRRHGIANYPDPGPHSGPGGGFGIYLRGVDLNSPRFKAAQQACKRYRSPDGKAGP